MQNGTLVWLASYPKSGNTWVRVILGALLAGKTKVEDVNLNSLPLSDHAGGRGLIEAVSACPSSELSEIEIDRLRPAAFRFLAKTREGMNFVKVHDAYRVVEQSISLFPADVSKCAIYIVRNPLDVAVSFAYHLGVSIDNTIELMSTNFMMGQTDACLKPQVRQQLGSWSDHVISWTAQQCIPLHVVRYEDLATDTEAELAHLAHVLEIHASESELAGAIAYGALERLQSAERKSGFREKPSSLKGPFFRVGRVGGWRQALTSRQVSLLVEHHSEVMETFGYLADI